MKKRRIYISLARDRSGRPMRGSPLGDLITGPCEAVGCGQPVHRGDRFIAFLGDRLMHSDCYEAGKALIVLAIPKKPRRARKVSKNREILTALRAARAARTRQLREELRLDTGT